MDWKLRLITFSLGGISSLLLVFALENNDMFMIVSMSVLFASSGVLNLWCDE